MDTPLSSTHGYREWLPDQSTTVSARALERSSHQPHILSTAELTFQTNSLEFENPLNKVRSGAIAPLSERFRPHSHWRFKFDDNMLSQRSAPRSRSCNLNAGDLKCFCYFIPLNSFFFFFFFHHSVYHEVSCGAFLECNIPGADKMKSMHSFPFDVLSLQLSE